MARTGYGPLRPDDVLAAFAGLHESSLAVALAPPTADIVRVNLLVPGLDPDAFFAGMTTAFSAAVMLAEELDLPLRVIALDESASAGSYAATRETLLGSTGFAPGRLELSSSAGLIADGFHSQDAWIATYWSTAHALDVAALAGLVDPARVVYLVQDFEPEFFGGSTQSALAENTYRAGFTLAVNSVPVRDRLRDALGIDVPDDLVFAPHLDADALRGAAEARETAPELVRIFFYGRPGKPRNMFSLGVAALRLAVRRLAAEGTPVEVVSAGLPHQPLDLGDGVVLSSVGTLDWAGYLELLSRVDVALSLQKSAHPSHPPLEAASSGAIAVTNELGGTRAGLHPRLIARAASPIDLAAGVVEAVARLRAGEDRSFGLPDPARLGGELSAVMSTAAAAVRARTNP